MTERTLTATLKCPLCGTKTERPMPTTQPYCERPTCGAPLMLVKVISRRA